jgi:hypothetical protein
MYKMTEHRKIKKAAELLQMIEFILVSSQKKPSSSKESRHAPDDSVAFPYPGLLHSVGEIKNILHEVLAPQEHSVSEKTTHEPETGMSDLKKVEGQKEKARESLPPRSSGLAGRIRPVPEEVRGRVRELVDMIEHEELSRSNYETTGA